MVGQKISWLNVEWPVSVLIGKYSDVLNFSF